MQNTRHGLSLEKAWHMDSGSELVKGNIISGTLTQVGKEFWPHEDHVDEVHKGRPVTDKARLYVRVGVRQHHSGSLLEEGIGVLPPED